MMTNIYIDLKNIKNNQIKKVNGFLNKIPRGFCVYAVVDIGRYDVDKNYKFPRIDKAIGTYGAVQRSADIFISFFGINYPDIASIILNKDIFSVSIAEKSVRSYVDLKIKDFAVTWEFVYNCYKNRKINSKAVVGNKRKKIAFITPLNTDKSAIARFSVCTLKELCKKSDVDVFSLEKQFPNDFGANKISYLTPEPYIKHSYDAIISVLGNSTYHNKMFDFHLKYGGNALVHDAHVLNYSKYLYGEIYIPNVARFYNQMQLTGEDKAKMYFDFSSLKVTGLEPIIEVSNKYYTHSKKQYDELIKKYNNIIYLPFCIYSNLDENKLNSDYKKTVKKLLGYNENDILIVYLGNISKPKLSHIVAEAFNKSKCRNNVKLVFVGSLDHVYSEFSSAVEGNDNIKYFNHFVADDLYKNYIYAADFAIQLRNSTSGQCSGALSDNISAGLYTIANDDLTDAIEAPSYCIGLKGIPSSDDIAREIEFTLKSEVYKKDYKRQRDEYIKTHNFDNYTNIILNNL